MKIEIGKYDDSNCPTFVIRNIYSKCRSEVAMFKFVRAGNKMLLSKESHVIRNKRKPVDRNPYVSYLKWKIQHKYLYSLHTKKYVIS